MPASWLALAVLSIVSSSVMAQSSGSASMAPSSTVSVPSSTVSSIVYAPSSTNIINSCMCDIGPEPVPPVWFKPVCPLVTYSPSNAWTCAANSNNTDASYWSRAPDAKAAININGGAFVIQAQQKYDRGFLTVYADNTPYTFDLYNKTANGTTNEAPVYLVFNFADMGEHKIVISNSGPDCRIMGGDNNATALDFYRFYIADVPSLAGDPRFPAYADTNGVTQATCGDLPGPTNGMAALLGGILGGVGGVALLGAALLYYLKWRRSRHPRFIEDRRASYSEETLPKVEPFQQPASVMALGGLPTLASQESSVSIREAGSPLRQPTSLPIVEDLQAEEDDSYASFRDAQSGNFVREARDWAPPSYAQIAASVASSSTAMEEIHPLPSPPASASDLRQPVRWQSSSSGFSNSSGKGFMPRD